MNFIKNFLTLSISFVMIFAFSGFVEKPVKEFSYPVVDVYSAQLNDDFTITLDESKPISANYEADISQFKSEMPNQVEAEKFISNFSRPYVQISFDLNLKKAFILLEFNEKTKSWSVADWNRNIKLK